mgnify:CR=1 FL=1
MPKKYLKLFKRSCTHVNWTIIYSYDYFRKVTGIFIMQNTMVGGGGKGMPGSGGGGGGGEMIEMHNMYP